MEWRRKLLTFQLFDAFFAAESLLFHIHLNAFLATAFAHPSPSEHQAASPDKPSPTPLTNSIQILQPAPVTWLGAHQVGAAKLGALSPAKVSFGKHFFQRMRTLVLNYWQ